MDKRMTWMQWGPDWGELRSSLGTEGSFPEVGEGGKVDFCHSLHLLLPTLSPGLMPKMEFASVGDMTPRSVTSLKGSFHIDLLTDPVMFRISKPAMLVFFFSQDIIARGKIGLIVMKSSNSFYFSLTDKHPD